MRFFALCAAFSSCAILFADDNNRRPLEAIRIETAPAIDGDLSDAIWANVPVATGFWDIQQNTVVADQTRVRVAYDAKHIYVSFEILDSQPESVTATETQEDSRFATDSSKLADDTVDIRIDPFMSGTYAGSSVFSVNAIGTRSANISGGRAKKTEWKGAWTAATKRTATGWTAEMQIPWEILNYPGKKTPQDYGINFFRYHARTKLPSYWSNIGPQEREENQGIWKGVIAPAPPKPTISLLPYIITGIDAQNRLVLRSGLDAKYPISAEMTAVGSINPDFGTIEGAVESVGFSRTERQIPERRPFFLEGQSFFRAGDGYDIGQFFYPRRIESFDIGSKVFGKLTNKDSIGLMQTLTIGERLDAVAKWEHKSSPYESYSFFANLKSTKKEDANVLSASYNKEFGKLAFFSRYAQSQNNSKTALATANGLWYSDTKHFTFLSYSDHAKDFRLPDGLLGFTGIKGWEIFDEVNCDWRNGPVRRLHTEVSLSHNTKLDGSPFYKGVSSETFIGLRNGWAVGFESSYYDYAGFIDRNNAMRLTKGWDNRFSQVSIFGGGGTNASEGSGVYGMEISQRVAKGLDVSYAGFFENYQGHTQQNVGTVAYELSPTRSFGGRVVTRNSNTNWYLSYRDSGKKGNEFFVILGDPNSRKFRQSLQVKAVIPL